MHRLLSTVCVCGSLAVLTACGAGRTGSLEDDPPELAIQFPSPGAIVDTAPLGLFLSAEDATGTTALDVNGFAATPQTAGEVDAWSVLVPLTLDADNQLMAEGSDKLGNMAMIGPQTVQSTPLFAPPAGLDVHGGQVLVAYARAIAAIDIASQARSFVSSVLMGAGPELLDPADLVHDAANARTLVLDRGLNAIVAVADGSGERTIFSGAGQGGTDNPLSGPAAAALDVAGARLLVVNEGSKEILAVALADGTRTKLAPPMMMPGLALVGPVTGAALDASGGGRLLIGDQGRKSILAIDLMTGIGSVFSGVTPAMMGPDVPVGTGPALMDLGGLALDAGGGRLLVVDRTLRALLSIALASGDRTVRSGDAIGTGAPFVRPDALTFDGAGTAFVGDFPDGVIAVTLGSGDRAPASTVARGGGAPAPGAGRDAELDAKAEQLYTLDGSPPQVLKIALATGERTVVSGAAVGSGPALVDPRDHVLDLERGRMFVVDAGLRSLLQIDLLSGDRTELSGPSTGIGPEAAALRGVAVDTAAERAYVTDAALPAVLVVDLATGNRSILSGASVGTGTSLATPHGIVLRARANATQHLLVASGANLLAVEIGTGDRSDYLAVAGATSERIALSADGTRGLLTTSAPATLRSFAAGDGGGTSLETLMEADDGLAPGIGHATGAVYGPHPRVVYVIDAQLRALLSLDRETRQRALISR